MDGSRWNGRVRPARRARRAPLGAGGTPPASDTRSGAVRYGLLALVLGCSAVLPAGPALAADSGEPTRGYLTFYLDNDLFGGTDRDYTNGLRLSWISEGEPLFRVLPARGFLENVARADEDYGFLRSLSGFDEESLRDGTLELNYGLSLTQLMFTPDDRESPVQPEGQRRYAGWLGLGFSVHARDHRALNSVEVIFGTTGPNSLARESQDLVHEVRGFDRFQGWDDQIPNELTLDLAFWQKRRARFLGRRESGFSFDGFTEWNARLGTFRTVAGFGAFFRAGFNLPADFSDPRISSTAYSHRFFADDYTDLSAWSAYALFGFRGEAVGHDATLDGPVFRDFDTGNDRELLVGEVFGGFGVRVRGVEFSYVHTLRSRTFEQAAEPSSDFGSLAFRVRL